MKYSIKFRLLYGRPVGITLVTEKKTRNINEMLRGVMKWLLLVGARFVRDRLCAICLADLVLHEKSAILTEKKAPNFLSTSEARVLIKLAVFSINLP